MIAAYGMLFVGLAALALCGGLLVLGLFAVRNMTYSGSGQAPASGGTSQDWEVVAGRYGRGEITKQQFEHAQPDRLV